MTEDELIEFMNDPDRLGPAVGRFGFCYGPAPACAALDEGIRQFVWFKTEREALEFLQENAAGLGMGVAYLDHNRVRDAVSDIVGRQLVHKGNGSAFLNSLNVALETFIVIEWLGSFEDLLLDTEAFPSRLRSRFAEEEEKPLTGGGYLQQGDQVEFARWLSTSTSF